jgi:hypothetical protein
MQRLSQRPLPKQKPRALCSACGCFAVLPGDAREARAHAVAAHGARR